MCSRIIFIVFTVVALKTVISDACASKSDITFRLYTRSNNSISKSLYVLNANFDRPFSDTRFNPKKQTRIFVHGFRTKEKVIKLYSEAYLKKGDYNFIAVDWLKCAATYNYVQAKGHVRYVRHFFLLLMLFIKFCCSCVKSC